MGLIPEQSFTVRKPAWWDANAEYVLADYPGREDAMRIAGHDWDVVTRPIGIIGAELGEARFNELPHLATTDAGRERRFAAKKAEGYCAHLRSDNGFLLHVARDSFERIPNRVAYDVAELLFEQGFVYETAGSMDGGRINYITLLLNEPIYIAAVGEESRALPYGCLSWAHDGSASLKVRSGTIVQVCQNTVSASEAEGKRLGTDFTFRHTKNVMERIEDAKKAVQGVRENIDVYRVMMEELAAIPVTPEERDLFVSTIIGDRDGVVSKSTTVAPRVKSNIERERAKINTLFFGETIPEEHRLTGYGLFQAGTEYFDHLRNFRSRDSYVKRTLLSDNPAKANLARTIRELAPA